MESSFTTLIGSRVWHIYQKLTWKNPKKNEVLNFIKETDPVALRFDPFSIAFMRQSIEYLTPITVGSNTFGDFKICLFPFGERWTNGSQSLSFQV